MLTSKFLLLKFYWLMGLKTPRPNAETLAAEISKASILCQERRVDFLFPQTIEHKILEETWCKS